MKRSNSSQSPKKGKTNRRKSLKSLQTVNLNAAGIDIGATHNWVAVPEDRDDRPVRRFESFTADCFNLAKWLKTCGVDTVVMESTGVYWIPLFQILEMEGFDVKLVNARHAKNVPGRKSDIADCQWLQQLHTFGLLSGSFRPENDICVLRSYYRHRETLIQGASSQVQRMQKALTQMNLHLHNVISDITGTTGMAIIRSILKGERDPKILAQLKDPRIQSSEEQIAKSLEGDYRIEHLFTLQQSVELYDFYQQQMKTCDEKIEDHLKSFEPKVDIEKSPLPKPKNKDKKYRRGNAPNFDTREYLYKISGIDLTQIEGINGYSAHVIVSEVGLDMSKFPTEKHFSSFLGLSPTNKASGGKILTRKTRKVVNRAAQVLRLAATSLKRSKSYLGAYYRRMNNRVGPSKAITATARKLACLIYRMLRFGQEYVDRGEECYEKQYQERVLKNLKIRAKLYGYELTPKQELTESVS